MRRLDVGHKVGPKGQVVIEKKIRDTLGIDAGWETIQELVDGHVEIHFVPSTHNRSLAGSLAPYIKRTLGPDDDWGEIRDAAWAEAARHKESGDGLVY